MGKTLLKLLSAPCVRLSQSLQNCIATNNYGDVLVTFLKQDIRCHPKYKRLIRGERAILEGK